MRPSLGREKGMKTAGKKRKKEPVGHTGMPVLEFSFWKARTPKRGYTANAWEKYGFLEMSLYEVSVYVTLLSNILY